jgi:hypothetical protein
MQGFVIQVRAALESIVENDDDANRAAKAAHVRKVADDLIMRFSREGRSVAECVETLLAG